MATFNTPGVYIQEISTLPPSVAPVPTSIPVFIGYTEKAEKNGDSSALLGKPTRIENFLDFQTIFGGAYVENFEVVLSGTNVDIAPVLDEDTPGVDYRLYYHMQMFFANGGSTCYIISVGDYSVPIDSTDLLSAIEKAEQVDEITMVVIPEAVSNNVTDSQQRAIYDTALAHCANMQDRFTITDVKVRGTSIANDASEFRDLNVSSNNLSYGAAYYPSFKPSFPFSYTDASVTIDATAANLPASVQAFDGLTLSLVSTGRKEARIVDFSGYTFGSGDQLDINGILVDLTSDVAANIKTDIEDSPEADAVITVETTANPDELKFTARTAGYELTTITIILDNGSGSATPAAPSPAALTPDTGLYNRIRTSLDAYPITLYPSATMAGVYTSVDTNRGVWKAPANLSLAMVASLNVKIKDSDQEGLNVDAVSGKSIDAIREFTGRGIMVWGARTLDGNSNEWRYVNVRRTFLFVEDSCKKATQFSVFEPNDMNLWMNVKGTISNFLTNLWRDGALAGSKPEQAFFVKVGLGETMTAQDILEGKMIVQIGMAVVRPAEFIVIQFYHKLQEA